MATHATAPLPSSVRLAFALVMSAVVLQAVAVAPEARAADARRGIAAIGASAITNISVGAPDRANAVSAGRIDYRSLKQLGVSARNARLAGKIVRVKLANKRRVEIRLAVIRDRQRKLQAWDAVTLKPGTRTLLRRLNKTLSGSRLNLRVTARIGNKLARGIISLKVISLPSPSGPSSSPPPPAGPTNAAPTSIALSRADVAENQPAGTTVGTLSGTDANAGETLSFALVSGAGSDDNAAFTLVGATLRTAATFDFEAKSSYAIRVRVSDGRGGTLEGALTLAVTDVDDPPLAANDLHTVSEDASASAIAVLTNDNDVDGGPKTINSASDPAHGTVVITGGGTRLTYAPDANYCNSLLGSADTFTYTLSGGSTAIGSMTVTCVDDAPVIASGGMLNYTEGDPATPVDAGLLLSDVDSATITGATVMITANHAAPEDVLAFADTATITGAYNSATGTLTLTGTDTDTVAKYRTALRAVTYRNTSLNPSNAARTVTFGATDGVDTSLPVTRGIAVTATNDGPVIDNSAGALAYTENDPAAAIDTIISVADPDSTNLTGATVQITAGYVQGQDILALPAQPDITALFDAPSGRLTLNGTTTVAAYETALESVTYTNTSENPSTAARTVTYRASDAGGAGFADTHGITISAVDDLPVALDDSATAAEDSAAAAIDVLANDTDADAGPKTISTVTQPANGTVVATGGTAGARTGLTYQPDANYCNDPPGTTPDTFTYELNGGSTATVSVTVTCADDPPVAVNDSDTVAEDAAATAISVLSNDTDIDAGPMTITSVTQPANGTVVATGGTAGARTGLTYEPDPNYCNDPPATTPDTFTYELNGGSTATVSMTVTCANDLPVANDDARTVAEDAAATDFSVLSNDVDVDPDAIEITAVGDPAHGTASVVDGSADLVRYTPDADYCNDPGAAPTDDVSYTVNGGDTATVAVTVTCANDAPALDLNGVSAGTGSTATFNETSPHTGTGVLVVDPSAMLSDVDDTEMESAAVTLTARPDGDSFESLSADAGTTGIGVDYTAATGTLALTGSATEAQYLAVLKSVRYDNAKNPPDAASRSIEFTVNDGLANSNTASATVTVVPLNVAPVLDLDDGVVAVGNDASVAFTEGDPALAPAPNNDITDPDDTQMVSATVTLTNRPDGSAEALTVDPSGTPITADAYVPSSGVLALSGSATEEQYEQVLATVKYANVDQTPTGTDRAVTFVVNDAQAFSNTATATVAVTPVADPPMVTSGGTLSYTENQVVTAIHPAVTVTEAEAENITTARAQIPPTTRPARTSWAGTTTTSPTTSRSPAGTWATTASC